RQSNSSLIRPDTVPNSKAIRRKRRRQRAGKIALTVMAFHIKNPETDALARRLAALKRTGLTEAVHAALKHELEREQARPSLVEIGVRLCRDLRARGKPDHGRPADKAFRDSLYD
ncbi:type II toxin-antitoxin system VapB family antitoxin, partial [Mesorhizobium sp. M0684]|uniref:type II toxin-antitoxin system VapB family antitoxin n=2 Tax=unclassified Mesorhizobium TaxID=325217 RepID=UPI003339491B